MNVEIAIDRFHFDVAFCLFAGFRDIPPAAASYKMYQQVISSLADDPTDAVQAVIRDAAERFGRKAGGVADPLEFEAYPGYIRVVVDAGFSIEVFAVSEPNITIRLEFNQSSKPAARRVARYVYEAYEGDISSAALAMAEIDCMA